MFPPQLHPPGDAPMSLSAEGQHLIDALETHFAAVKTLAENATTEAVKHAEEAWGDVQSALEAAGAQLRAAGVAQQGAAAAAVNEAAAKAAT